MPRQACNRLLALFLAPAASPNPRLCLKVSRILGVPPLRSQPFQSRLLPSLLLLLPVSHAAQPLTDPLTCAWTKPLYLGSFELGTFMSAWLYV